jgi:hypothetical protein
LTVDAEILVYILFMDFLVYLLLVKHCMEDKQ